MRTTSMHATFRFLMITLLVGASATRGEAEEVRYEAIEHLDRATEVSGVESSTLLPFAENAFCQLRSPLDYLFDPERERCLPIGREEIRRLGIDLPLPFGVGATVAYLDQGMDIDQIRVGAAGGPVAPITDIPSFRIKSRDTNYSTRYDAWILPCLNVYAIVGHTRGSAVGDVVVNGVPGLTPGSTIPIRIDYEGPTYGGGCTAAIGYENFFAVVDWNYAKTELPGLDNSIDAQTVGPRIGYVLSDDKQVWVGGFYQTTDKILSASVDVGGVPVQFLVDLDVSTPWNFIYGGRWAPNENIELIIEHGFSGRNQVIGAVSVRF